MKKLIIPIIAGALFAANVRAQSVDTLITGLFEPYAVAVDTNNNYYITDSANNSIIKYTPESGQITNFSGRASITRDFADGPSYLAKFGSPQGIVAARGGFVVADSGNNRIRFISMDGTVSTLAGTGVAGTNDAVNGLNAQFNAPTGLAADAAGNIYIADLGNSSIRKLKANNQVVTLTSDSDANALYHPTAVAVSGDGRIFVADTGNNSIKVFHEGESLTLLAGSGLRSEPGLRDSLLASEALFKEPRGLLYIGGQLDTLYISDSGNKILRRIYTNSLVLGFSVDTVQATVGSGLGTPIGLARDSNNDLLIVDLLNNQLRRIVSGEKQEIISDPEIGTAELITDPNTGNVYMRFTPVSTSVFNNDVVVAISPEAGTETFYTVDGTDPSGSHGSTPPVFSKTDLFIPLSIIDSTQLNAPSDVTIRAISIASGRRSSSIVTARFQFQVANPIFIGRNAAAVSMSSATADPLIYYTTDGTDPNQDSYLYTLGDILDISDGKNDVTLKARAYRNGYTPSRIVSQVFKSQDVENSAIGIPRDFVAGIGSTLIVPVEVDMLPTDILRSLQFRVEVTALNGAPSLPTPIQVLKIDPSIDFITLPQPSTNFSSSVPFRSTYSSGPASGLLFGYLGTNSFFAASNAMTVAMLAVSMPLTAVEGQQYQIDLLYPSGTSDGFEAPIVLRPMDSRTITISNISYVVGDSAQSTWYNAGDFGNGNLNNNDVNNAFYASLGIHVPYVGSDIFNAMDVDRSTLISLNDWNTIFRRSLRLDLANVARSWSLGGVLVDSATELNGAANTAAETLGPSLAWAPDGTLQAGTVQNVSPGTVVSVPLTLKVGAGISVSGFQFLATVYPENGAPFIAGPVALHMADNLTGPTLTAAKPSGAGFGWAAGSFSPPLQGTVAFGQLRFTIPPGAKSGQSYTVRLSAVQANDIEFNNLSRLFTLQSIPARVWIETNAQFSPDILSDEWKLKFFGSLTNPLATPFADADADGKNNLEEFLAGTNPTEHLFQQLDSEWHNARTNGFKLRWFAAGGKTYIAEGSTDMITWTEIARVNGANDLTEVVDSQTQSGQKFYRVRLAP